jgi:hypothetical protein
MSSSDPVPTDSVPPDGVPTDRVPTNRVPTNRAPANRVPTGTQAAGRVVAELGRPETPEETARRKAENSRAHRANQTTRNLILALIASLAIVLFTVLVVVRPSNNLVKTINYRAVAAQAQQAVSVKLAAPPLSKQWTSNDAELKYDNGKTVDWYVGLLTPGNQFIAIEQGVDTSNTWFGSLLGRAPVTGHLTIAGVHWTEYNQRQSSGAGNFQYSLAATIGPSNFVLHGSADDAEFSELATAIAKELK